MRRHSKIEYVASPRQFDAYGLHYEASPRGDIFVGGKLVEQGYVFLGGMLLEIRKRKDAFADIALREDFETALLALHPEVDLAHVSELAIYVRRHLTSVEEVKIKGKPLSLLPWQVRADWVRKLINGFSPALIASAPGPVETDNPAELLRQFAATALIPAEAEPPAYFTYCSFPWHWM